MFTNERLFTIQAFTITRVHCTSVFAQKGNARNYMQDLSATHTYFFFKKKSKEILHIYITEKCHKLLGECFTTTKKKEPRAWEGLKLSSSIQLKSLYNYF